MSLEVQVTSLVTAIGADIKQLRIDRGDLTSLTTTAKTSLVAALNELASMIGGAGVSIDDVTPSGSTTYSSNKIVSSISAAVSDLIASAPGTLDTLNELATALGNDPAFATTIATALSNRVRYDAAQTLTTPQQAQACANIGVGDPAHNFVADYTAAKA